jgi:hypothetical protein
VHIAVAGYAVDGNTDGEFLNSSTTHTKDEQGAWWRVDLGSKKNIKQFDENNLDDLDLDSNDISKNKYSTSSAVNEEEALELQSLDS